MSLIREKLDSGTFLPRHLHNKPYATLVLEGSYIEAGDHGRFNVAPGDILVHGHFSSHTNWIAPQGDVKTLNIEVSDLPEITDVCMSQSFDTIVRFAQYDIPLAIDELLTSLTSKRQKLSDWPDVLANDIRENPEQSIQHWCGVLDLAPATVSRGFRRAFGVTATRYRMAVRTRGAYLGLMERDCDLSELAQDWGFSDQSHFARAIRALTGQTPTYWQRVKNLQDGNKRLN